MTSEVAIAQGLLRADDLSDQQRNHGVLCGRPRESRSSGMTRARPTRPEFARNRGVLDPCAMLTKTGSTSGSGTDAQRRPDRLLFLLIERTDQKNAIRSRTAGW